MTQKNWVLSQLQQKGEISRNECLRNYISRLGAIINTLKKEGHDIKGGFVEEGKGKDYVYSLYDIV